MLRVLCTGACVSLVNTCMARILYMPRGAEVDCVSLLNMTLSSSSFEVYQCCRQAFQSSGGWEVQDQDAGRFGVWPHI
ncbi:sodium/nucleoside cotransporter 1-like [Kogia breviceps]|uniref:sodium/nucleoside cotransporter 1-like n=1 Tax=Kogia breviceps TaxID=27615 RepID=UPI0034D344C3